MILSIIIWLSTGISGLHPYHVSVCDVEYNDETKALEIIHHIFLDDFEEGLRKAYDPKLDIVNPQNVQERDHYIEEYISANFSVSINGKPKSVKYLGHEIDQDAMLCYIEIEGVKKLKDVSITNTLLMEVFDDQINLVHVEVAGKVRSLKLGKKESSGLLEYDN